VKENLKHLIRSLVNIDDTHLDNVVHCFKPKTVKRNTFLLSEGEICKEFYYVSKGCIRTYFISKLGHEKTRFVILDHNIGTALASFIFQKPSIEIVDTLEDTNLLAISHKDFYKLAEEIPEWKTFYQKILELAYTFQNKKIEDRVTLSAKQRYYKVLKETPFYVQRLSNKVLASYLDITQETLSRLKSK